MKMLYLDIETTPVTSRNWGVWDQNAVKVIETWRVLGMCYAWGDGVVKDVYPAKKHRVTAYSEDIEYEVMGGIWNLLDDADLVVAHNGDKFDLKKINARLVRLGYGPPSPYLSIDTLKESRKNFAFEYHRLDQLGQYFGLGGKQHHSGYDMWEGCMGGNEKSWREMIKYNRRDVALLREVYKVMRPWMKTHPNMGNIEGCHVCGSMDSHKRGVRRMKSGITYQQWQCNRCDSYFRERKAESSPATRA